MACCFRLAYSSMMHQKVINNAVRHQMVNTRDLIDLIRIVRENLGIALKPASIIPAH